MLHRIGFLKCRASTKAKVSVEDFEEKKEQLLLDVKAVVNLRRYTIGLSDKVGPNRYALCSCFILDNG